MNICSVCGLCYDDSVTNCIVKDHGSLTESKQGDCFSVKGYKINSEIKSDFPHKLYQATHLSSKKNVLIKFIETDSFDEKLEAEIKTVSQINHPNLARVFEFGKFNDTETYIVLEDIPGQNLREFLEQKSPLLERHAIKIARQIAEGLEVLHEAGVIHRLVNPSNIYFANADNSDFSVKLQNYDFGGVEQKIIADGATGIDAKTEIFRFFSPEQFTGETIDFKSDLYSLAVVFYEMLLGRSPYNIVSPQAISKYVFDETDVEKLHYDLRALLAYTLKQSLQHRLNLRPPTTNNLARQYRHLELVAVPPAMGMQEKLADRNKAKKTVNISQLEKIVAAEEKLPVFEIIDNEITAEENIVPVEENIAPVIETAPEILTEEKAIPMPDFTGGLSVAAEENSYVTFVENKIETPKIFEPSIETKAETFDEIPTEIEGPEIYISRETTKLDNQVSDKAYINFNTTDLSAFDEAFDSIHITNRDDEEPVQVLSEVFEYEEPEFVEEESNEKSDNERQPMDYYISYAAPRSSSFNKNYVYIASALVLFIVGGLFAASFWQSRSSQTAAQAAPQKSAKTLSAEKKEPIVEPEKVKETAEITEEAAPLPQFDGQQTNEVSTVEEVTAKPTLTKNTQNETAVKVENKTAPTVKEKIAIPVKENKVIKTEPAKKQEKTQTVKMEDIQKTTVIVVGKTKPSGKKTDTTGRPRVVSTSPSGN